jgi:hypothetical protein
MASNLVVPAIKTSSPQLPRSNSMPTNPPKAPSVDQPDTNTNKAPTNNDNAANDAADSPPAAPAPNFRVAGKYALGKKIGSGAFGDIYIGANIETHESVAVKMVCRVIFVVSIIPFFLG